VSSSTNKLRRAEPLKAKYGRVGPLLNKQTVFGWVLEKRWLWIFFKSQCPEWGRPQRLAEKFM
jgi:hypothetical protein